jgi:hypothetical protein
MKYDLFEFNTEGMRWQDRAVRIIFLLAVVTVCLLDLFVWRP